MKIRIFSFEHRKEKIVQNIVPGADVDKRNAWGKGFLELSEYKFREV